MEKDLLLRTERLDLRPVERGHAAALFLLMQDERLTRYLAWAPHRSASETDALVDSLIRAQSEGSAYHWTIFEQDEVRGLISLIDVRRKHRLWILERAEIAYWVGVEQQGRGIAKEATRAVVEAAFSVLNLHRLVISHSTSNPASGRIPVSLGFRYIGTEHEFFQKNDVWFDMNHYEMLERDWRAQRSADREAR